MPSTFNTLLHGSAEDAAEILGGDCPPQSNEFLRAALTNALGRIARLEHLATLKSELDKLIEAKQRHACPWCGKPLGERHED